MIVNYIDHALKQVLMDSAVPRIPEENDGDNRTDAGTSVLTRPRQRVERAPMYKVILLNDDYTPMEFVVAILEHIFQMQRDRAFSLMLDIHNTGVGIAGVFTHEIAETKANQVMAAARNNEHPLRCTIERD